MVLPGFGREADRALGWRQGAQDAARDGGFAAAALADQSQSLTALDRKAHILHRAHPTRLALQQPASDRELLGQSIHLEHGHALASAIAWKQFAPGSPGGISGGACVAQRPSITSGQRG